MIRSVIKKGRPIDWVAGIAIPVLCAGMVLAQQPPPPVAVTSDKAPPAVAPNPKSAAAVELDKKIMAEIKDHSEIMKNLEYISDVIGPRLTGSSNLEKANKWTAEKMKEYGLENVHLEPWEIPMGWERGTARLTLKEPQVKELMVASYAWAPGTKGNSDEQRTKTFGFFRSSLRMARAAGRSIPKGFSPKRCFPARMMST